MEEAKTIPHWVIQALQSVALFLAGGTLYRIIALYLNRKKPKAEIHETEARATAITIRSSSNAGDAVIRMMDRLEETQEKIDNIRDDSYDLKLRFDLQVIELRHRENEIKKLRALLVLHGIKYSEADEHKLNEHPKE